MKRTITTLTFLGVLLGLASPVRAEIPTFDPAETKLAYGPGYRRYPPPASRQPTYYAPGYYDLRHGAVVLVYAGLNFPVGAGSNDYSAGFNLGGIFGGHLNRDVSLNGELSVSFLNYNYASSFDSESLVDVTFSPLFHFGQGNVEFAVGPKLGFYTWSMGYNDGYYAYNDYSAHGVVFGVNAILLFQVARTFSIGGLLSVYGHHATSECYTYPDGVEVCGNPTYTQPNLVTLNFAMRW